MKITENCPTVLIHYLHRLANFTAPRWPGTTIVASRARARQRASRAEQSGRVPAFALALECTRVNILERLLANTPTRPGAPARPNEFTISSNFLVNRRYTPYRASRPDEPLRTVWLKLDEMAASRTNLCSFISTADETTLAGSSKSFRTDTVDGSRRGTSSHDHRPLRGTGLLIKRFAMFSTTFGPDYRMEEFQR